MHNHEARLLDHEPEMFPKNFIQSMISSGFQEQKIREQFQGSKECHETSLASFFQCCFVNFRAFHMGLSSKNLYFDAVTRQNG